ncbi:hypothetical protein D3C83_127020 [compost metagenome]
MVIALGGSTVTRDVNFSRTILNPTAKSAMNEVLDSSLVMRHATHQGRNSG